MAEFTPTDLGVRQGLNPLQRAKSILLGWPLQLIGASATSLLLTQQPARALTYNLVEVNVSFQYGTFFGIPLIGSSAVTGSFDYTAGDQQGVFSLDSVGITYDATPNFFDNDFNQGFVVNNFSSSYLVFYQGLTPEIPLSLDCTDATSPCLRLNLDQYLDGTAFQEVVVDGGSNLAGSSSTFDVFGTLQLTRTGGTPENGFNVIRAVPSPFSALLVAPLLPLLRYRRRFLSATQQSAQPNGSTIGH